MAKELIGQLAEAAIKELKASNSGIFAIEVSGHIAYFREPELSDMNFAASQVDADTPLDFNKILMAETLIGGSQQVIDEKSLFLGASKQFTKKIEGDKAKLVQL